MADNERDISRWGAAVALLVCAAIAAAFLIGPRLMGEDPLHPRSGGLRIHTTPIQERYDTDALRPQRPPEQAPPPRPSSRPAPAAAAEEGS